ncbi:hypothetical protein BKA58DRAFT_382391 [Alternaria rosae]|uniref:uncharacterized protein n=1 Tax=Alternaria rosae TaxID=1187941 RepID=UPI001E8E52E7|nr:uncharacterized protein BKA58DRAFT_382391 [Alternaria rosae]KAH6872645.1 hypothetical protein BKA58DRAFT_382391 [Alternaria rosae]
MSGQIEEPAINFKSEYGPLSESYTCRKGYDIDRAYPFRHHHSERWQGRNHEAVIRRSSKFFDNPMKEEWAASRLEARTISIVDKDPTIFKIYLHWLYLKTFPIVTTKSTGGFNHETGMLGKSYVVGEMLMDTALKNAVLIAFRDAPLNRPFYKPLRPGFSIVKTIYDGTPEGSPGRRFMVDVCVREANEN